MRIAKPRSKITALLAAALAAVLGVAGSAAPAKGAPSAAELKVMSYNMWFGGTNVRNHREKQLRFLRETGVDVVAIQEQYDTAGRELAEALGWYAADGGSDLAIISRFPLKRVKRPTRTTPALNARVRIGGSREVSVWNAHLGYNPYGPYDMCFGRMTEERLMEREEQSGRTPQIRSVLRAMRRDLAGAEGTPVILAGDFNAPSHLDYTPATAERHCGYDRFAWPTSVLPERAGLTDSFREVNPDPAAVPGDTWSPVYKTFTGGYGYDDHKGEPEPQDRIDFVHYAGGLSVRGSSALVAGDPAPYPDHADNEWTSDHAAVLTSFAVD